MNHLQLFENFTPLCLTDLTYDEIENFCGVNCFTEEIMDTYRKIEQEPTITLYRAIGVMKHWDMNYGDIGLHWTTDCSLFGSPSFFDDIVIPYGYDGGYVVITAEVNTKDVDKETTLQKNRDCVDELEVTLLPGAKYKVIDNAQYESLEYLIAAYRISFDD